MDQAQLTCFFPDWNCGRSLKSNEFMSTSLHTTATQHQYTCSSRRGRWIAVLVLVSEATIFWNLCVSKTKGVKRLQSLYYILRY